MEREQFTFYKSYFRVYSRLKTHKQKTQFIEAVMMKEFYNVDPKEEDLDDLVMFAYESQKHSIEKQVIGYLRAKNIDSSELRIPLGGKGGSPYKEVEEEVEEEEEEKEEYIKEMKNLDDEYDLENPDLILLFHGVVKLTAFQFDSLLNKYDKGSIDEKILGLATGIHNKNKKYLAYKNHYMTLQNWLRRDGKGKLPGNMKGF